MILGHIIIGTVNAEQQIKFVRDKELKKLWTLLKKRRLDEVAEAEMIEHPEGLEDFIKAYLQKYKVFVKDNNKLFVQKHAGHPGLFAVFCEVFDYSQSDEKAGYEIMLSLVKQAGIYPDEAQKIWPLVKAYFRKYGYIQAYFAQLDDYCRIWTACPQYRKRYLVSEAVEAAFLLPENRDVLLQFLGHGGRFQHHENEFRFFAGYEIYPQQAGEYLAKFGKELVLTEDEWKKLLVCLLKQKAWNFVGAYLEKYGNAILKFDQLDEYFHVWLVCPQYRDRYLVSKAVEAAFLLPENRDVLLQFLGHGGRFQHHENEFRFLMMNDLYPQEVDNYLEKFGKDLNLTEKEQKQLFSQNLKAIRYVDITSNLVLFKEFVLPEIRRQRLPVLEDDFSLLVKLSWDYPDWLRDYLKKHVGRYGLENDKEAELFFCADKQIRLEYGEKFGFDTENLVEQASKFGVEPQIVAELRRQMACVREEIFLRGLDEYNLKFNLAWISNKEFDFYWVSGHTRRFPNTSRLIPDNPRKCVVCKMLHGYSCGGSFYAKYERYFSPDMLKFRDHLNNFCAYWCCIPMDETFKDSLCSVRRLLENAVDRRYLTA